MIQPCPASWFNETAQGHRLTQICSSSWADTGASAAEFEIQVAVAKVHGQMREKRMATEDTLVICDLATLQMWRHKLRSNMWTRNLPTVQFQLPEFSYEQNNNLAALASGFQGACGCASGGFFMSVTVVATIGSYFMSGSRFANINLPQVVFEYHCPCCAFRQDLGPVLGAVATAKTCRTHA